VLAFWVATNCDLACSAILSNGDLNEKNLITMKPQLVLTRKLDRRGIRENGVTNLNQSRYCQYD
jgi:hypothetical protein